MNDEGISFSSGNQGAVPFITLEVAIGALSLKSSYSGLAERSLHKILHYYISIGRTLWWKSHQKFADAESPLISHPVISTGHYGLPIQKCDTQNLTVAVQAQNS